MTKSRFERGGDASARALDDVDAREGEAFRFEPALRLHLRGRAGALGAARQEDDLPAAVGWQRRRGAR